MPKNRIVKARVSEEDFQFLEKLKEALHSQYLSSAVVFCIQFTKIFLNSAAGTDPSKMIEQAVRRIFEEQYGKPK